MNKKLLSSIVVSGVLTAALATSAFAQYGHNNVAGVGTASSNSFYNASYQSTYSLNQTHAEIGKLKGNLKTLRAQNAGIFSGVAAITSTDNTFDQATKNNLIAVQSYYGLTADGVYGAASRNALHGAIGVSPKGWVRVDTSNSYYINYNDTASGLSGDSTYKLDHGWVTSTTKSSLYSIAQQYYNSFSKKLEINDASLIDGADTPEHASHDDGKSVDVRNAGLTDAQAKKLLEIIVADSNVKNVRYYKNHGVSSSKIIIDASHNDHFHIATNN